MIMTTLGTGIGSAIVYRGVLVPNSELGHLEIDGMTLRPVPPPAQGRRRAFFSEYVPRLQRYFERLEALLWPDLIVIGGGVKNSDKFIPKLKLNAEVVPAKLLNTAGMSAQPGSRLTARSTPTSCESRSSSLLSAYVVGGLTARHCQQAPRLRRFHRRQSVRGRELHPFQGSIPSMVSPAASTRLVAEQSASRESRTAHRGLQHRTLLVEDGQRTRQLIEVVAQPVRLKSLRHLVNDVSEPDEQQASVLPALPAPAPSTARHNLEPHLPQDLGHSGVRVLQIGSGVACGLHHPADVEDVVLVQPVGQVGVLDRGERDRRRSSPLRRPATH